MKNLLESKRVEELEEEFINEFIDLRNKLNLTQKQMGDASNTIREMIAVIETRKKHPRLDTLIKILEPFGYKISITKIEEEEEIL